MVDVRSLYTKKAQGGGGSSPATVPWKGEGSLLAGRGQEGVSGTSFNFQNGSMGEKAEPIGDESQGQPGIPLLGPQPMVSGGTVRSGQWGRDRAPSLSYIQTSLPL